MIERAAHAVNGPRHSTSFFAIALFVAMSGCSQSPGERQSSRHYMPASFSASVNGLNVLADMLTAAGYTVRMRGSLSPTLKQQADVVIWAPDDFDPPAQETCNEVDAWLRDKENRTFVYIGHDFDARLAYWRQIIAQAAPADRGKYQEELDRTTAEDDLARQGRPAAAQCDWFSIDGTAKPRAVHSLDGPWAEGIDASRVAIELNSRILPSNDAEPLLADGDTIVARETLACLNPQVRWLPEKHTSNLILVANGSFLFNVPLVNHEHRKLAGRLIDSFGAGKRVVILDGQNLAPMQANDDDSPDQSPQSMLDIFNVWPLSAILVQGSILIALLCFAKWPIFGPPRDPPPAAVSDFGRHIDAMGAALAGTGDAAYAQSRVQQYRQVRDAAGSRAINRTNVKKLN
jgi:hypothetical protein